MAEVSNEALQQQAIDRPDGVERNGTGPTEAQALAGQFDPFHDPDLADPYPFFAQARAATPVFYSPDLDHWIVTRYHDIRHIFQTPRVFSAANTLTPLQLICPAAGHLLDAGGFRPTPTLTNIDPPWHSRLRRLANVAFTPRRVAPDVFFVPGGGRGAIEALQDDELLDAIAAIGVRAGWVTSVCTGALLLGAAGLLKGYRSACYWYARHHLEKFAAIPDEARYVIDRNRVSGGGMTAGIDFALHMIGVWNGAENGRLTELLMEYAPQPPFGVGRPDLAPPQTLAAADPILEREMPCALVEQAARRRRI